LTIQCRGSIDIHSTGTDRSFDIFFLKISDHVTFFFIWGLLPLAILHFSSTSRQHMSFDMKTAATNVDLAVSNQQQEKRRTALKEKISLNKTTLQFLLVAVVNFVLTAIFFNVIN